MSILHFQSTVIGAEYTMVAGGDAATVVGFSKDNFGSIVPATWLGEDVTNCYVSTQANFFQWRTTGTLTKDAFASVKIRGPQVAVTLNSADAQFQVNNQWQWTNVAWEFIVGNTYLVTFDYG